MTKARTIADLGTGFVNISDSGTTGTKVASGTTEQRGSTAGQIRFNTTTGLAEYYTGSEFKVIDSPPTVTVVSPLEVDSAAGGNITFTITGSNFNSGATVKFIGNDATEITASTTTVNSGSSISAIIARSSFVGAKEPYDIKVINSSGLSGTLDNQINVDVSPAWSTASGTLATISDVATGTHATVSATDADGDTVSYSETGGTVLTTAGLTLNSSTGAISGDPTNVNTSTTYSFNLRATANSKTVDRAFNIVVNPTYSLPTAYQSLVDSRTTGTKYYVSWSVGSDSNNGTSKSTPFKTLAKVAQTVTSNDTVILAPETHFVSGDHYQISGDNSGIAPVISPYYNTGSSPTVKSNVYFVGYPQKTWVVAYGNTNRRDAPFFIGGNGCLVIGCILERQVGLGGSEGFNAPYMYSILHGTQSNNLAYGGSSANRIKIWNCVLKNTSDAPTQRVGGVNGADYFSWIYDNPTTAYGHIDKTTIYNGGTGNTWTNSYSGASNAVDVSDLLSKSNAYGDAKSFISSQESNVALNSTGFYRSSQSATVADTNSKGAYSGTYSWHLASYPASAFNGNW
jgi:hypothetical protein